MRLRRPVPVRTHRPVLPGVRVARRRRVGRVVSVRGVARVVWGRVWSAARWVRWRPVLPRLGLLRVRLPVGGSSCRRVLPGVRVALRLRVGRVVSVRGVARVVLVRL
ncbi:MAG: hypothetical protein ACJ735_08975, partial [Actinomycetes bacterium]